MGEAFVVGDDAFQLVAQRERNGEVDGVEGAFTHFWVQRNVSVMTPAASRRANSLRHPELVPATAKLLADQLGLPLRPIVAKVRETPQQKLQQNSGHQEHNVDGAFELTDEPLSQPVFLFDDLVDSRWTFTTIGVLLRQKGSGPVYPLALASLMGRDS